jgi:hypothetical protein
MSGHKFVLPCPSTDGCSLAKGGACKPYGRLNVTIGDDDPLGSFVFRTTGFNSIRTLSARLQYFQAISGNRLSCLPLELRLRGKSTRQSHGTPIYYVDITVRTGIPLEESFIERMRQPAVLALHLAGDGELIVLFRQTFAVFSR